MESIVKFIKPTEAGYNKALDDIRVAGKQLSDNIHLAGLYALLQANLHGNIGFGTRLLEAIGARHDCQRVANWLVAFGKFGIKDKALVYRNRKDIKPESIDAFFEKAANCPYWQLTPPKALKETYDYLTMLKSIIAKHDKKGEQEQKGKTISEVNTHVLDEVKSLLDRLNKATTATEQQANVATVQANVVTV